MKITDDPENRPAFIHCTAAIRVGAFWMIRRVLRDGWKVEDAEAEAVKVGLRESPHWIEFARKYIETHQAESIVTVASVERSAFLPRVSIPQARSHSKAIGWPKSTAIGRTSGSEVELLMSGGPGGCDGPGKYRFDTDGKHLSFNLVSDECRPRRMILDRSTWLPAGEVVSTAARDRQTATARPPARPIAS